MSKSTAIKPKARDHAQGPEEASAVLIEYGDFQCPHCAQAYPVVKQLQRELGNALRFVYRHFPLVQIHEYAGIAAEAAEAAGAQGRFWEMHDLLYENQERLSPEMLTEGAADLGLDVARFTEEINEHAHVQKIEQDVEGGMKAGVHGTPTFFVNGVLHEGPRDYLSLLEALLAARRSGAAG